MNARMKDALDEALILSDKCDTLLRSVVSLFIFFCRIIQDLVAVIVKEIGALYKASEAVIPLISHTYQLLTKIHFR